MKKTNGEKTCESEVRLRGREAARLSDVLCTVAS